MSECRNHHNTCPRGERCLCYVTGYTDAEYEHGHVYELLDDKLTIAEKRVGFIDWLGAEKLERWMARTQKYLRDFMCQRGLSLPQSQWEQLWQLNGQLANIREVLREVRAEAPNVAHQPPNEL